MHLELKDRYEKIIGKTVSGRIDRPIGSSHPNHKDLIYPINYGYVDDCLAADGEQQDVYLIGIDYPVAEFKGKVIAVIHRLDDIEDKWVVSIGSKKFSDAEILEQVKFQEKYFSIEILR